MISPIKLRVPISKDDHVQGLSNAPLTLLEYGDYECPYCGQAHQIVKQIQKTFGKDLRFVFRHFPLTQIHPYAFDAAKAAEAANLQRQFWKMHDTLFENQEALDPQSLVAYAQELQLDINQFVADFGSDAVEKRIAADLYGGARSGVNGTPTFFINGYRYDGSWVYQPLQATLQAELASRHVQPQAR